MFRSVALYLVLVGGPLGGLLAILRAGGSIEPPPAVGGTWRVAGDSMACSAWPQDSELAIQQSGRFLRVRVAGGELHRAQLDAGRLRGRFPIEAGVCAGHLATVDASLDTDTHALVGTVDVHSCSVCPRSHLVAVRDP